MIVQGKQIPEDRVASVRQWIMRSVERNSFAHVATVADMSWVSVGLPHSTVREVARRLFKTMRSEGILRHNGDGRWLRA